LHDLKLFNLASSWVVSFVLPQFGRFDFGTLNAKWFFRFQWVLKNV